VRGGEALFDRVFENLDVVPDIADAPDAVDSPSPVAGRVALKDVYFRYPGASEDALRGVSLGAEPGQLVALVGLAVGWARGAVRGQGAAWRAVGLGAAGCGSRRGSVTGLAETKARGRGPGPSIWR
jgi:hypothetical protein